jgi:aryl-alcohol dehydrogenase-like predicted oxidoreductase
MAQTRLLGGRAINPVGLGCMNVSWAYGAPPAPADAARLLNMALDLGCQHLDTARIYGGGANEQLLGEALKGRRREFFLASKTGLFADSTRRWIDCRPETIRVTIEDSLRALRTDYIDLYYLHRRDFSVPIEDWAGAMGELVQAGKIGGYGLSEMSAGTLRRAHAVHPVTAVQLEYSLWTRNPEIAALAATRELGVALVAFSPLGRGALTGMLRDPALLEDRDLRREHPLAAGQGITAAQLSLAWVLSRGDHVHVIPGTTNPAHLAENLARTNGPPDAELLAVMDRLINQSTVSGPRYPEAMQRTMDSEDFA